MDDLEKHAAAPLQEARYENARWWRNINRMMAFVGMIILVCVVSILSSNPLCVELTLMQIALAVIGATK